MRVEIRHSFWLLNRVASAKAMERLLKKHDVFKDYTVVLASGDGRSDDGTVPVVFCKLLDKVRTAMPELPVPEIGSVSSLDVPNTVRSRLRASLATSKK